MIFILARHAKVKPLNTVLENWYSNMSCALTIYILSNLLSLFHSYVTFWLSRTRFTTLSTTGSTELMETSEICYCARDMQFVNLTDQLVNIFLLHLTFLNSMQSKLHVQPLTSLGGTWVSIFVPLTFVCVSRWIFREDFIAKHFSQIGHLCAATQEPQSDVFLSIKVSTTHPLLLYTNVMRAEMGNDG
jgi:hypothetical protein